MKKKRAAKAAKKSSPKAVSAVWPDEPTLTPIVGVGASAGGLEAFQQLLGALPVNTGMAFVLVQHLDPKHDGILPKLLAKATKMPVAEVTEGMHVEPNHIYVIPANADMSLVDGLLHLEGRKAPPGHHLPIDYFLTSLAHARGPQAVGVILSGAASDGTAGVKAIKNAGGMTFAQNPESARFDSMPRSAIGSGCVDLVLPPDRIARELGRLIRNPYLGMMHEAPHVPGLDEEWARLFQFLRRGTGIDFSLYKPSTIKRRLARRMAVSKVEKLGDYLKLLQQDQREVSALLAEILILVTEFFRDPEVFAALRTRIFPKILDDRDAADPLRIWVAGCSTGEECYSIAITLLETLGTKAAGMQIQIFATDVSEAALEKARQGVYAPTEVKGISPQQLRRYFKEVAGNYQVVQRIREMCLFSRHDLTRDPPFSRLDLISCRNVLIYMETVLQKRILAGFHWALKPNGFLLLGKSESLGSHSELFSPLSRQHKFFRKTTGAVVPMNVAQPGYEHVSSYKGPVKQPPVRADVEREADQALWERSGYAGLVVNGDLQILHVRGDTSRYVRLVPGKASLQLMRALREEIVLEVRAALQKARRGNTTVRREDIEFAYDGHTGHANIEVRPLIHSGPEKSFLILFEPAATAPERARARQSVGASGARSAHNREVTRLRDELARARDYVQAIIRDQEATNEELKTANEEALSSMEELQSSNEELETAKEELQSSNEELVTLNEQLQNRNSEVAQLSGELGDVLSGIDIPVVILDSERRIRRFTPPAERLLGLIQGDMGRPIDKLRIGIDAPGLNSLITAALKKGSPGALEMQVESGRWYSIRVLPFLVGDDKVQGVLMTFVDVDEARKLQEKTTERAEHSESVVRALLETATQAVIVIDQNGRIRLANAAAETMFGRRRDVLLGLTLETLMPEHFRALHARHRAGWFAQPRRGTMGAGLELTALRADGTEFPIEVSLSSIHDAQGTLGAAFITDITERKKHENVLLEFRNQLTSEVKALGRLRETAEHMWRSHDLRSGLEDMIDAGMALLGADFGNIQLLDSEKQVLRIVAQRGLRPEFLERFSEVSTADTTACGRSLQAKQRVVIADVKIDAEYAPHRDVAARADYRAVQSTPLFSSDSQVIGIFSTHFRKPHWPSDEELARFDLYANQAAQFIERMRAEEQLKRLSGALLSTQEVGNREIARELHDVFSQELAVVGMDISSLRDILNVDGEAAQRLTDLAAKVEKLSTDLHQTARELHPAILEDLGLEPALRQECESFQQRTGIRTQFRRARVPLKIAQDAALCLYRIAQEAMRNVQKHSKSSSVAVVLEGAPGGISLRVEDAGRGFERQNPQRKAGLGLVSMEERVRLVNGNLTIESRPGKGTTVAAFIPSAQG